MKITTTHKQLAAAFTQWNSDFRKDESKFMTAEQMRKTRAKTLGGLQANELISRLDKYAK